LLSICGISKDNLYCALGTHDSNFTSGPCDTRQKG
jgi:hypothetical protein